VIKSSDAVKFVVMGQVVQGDSVQRINISMTSPVSEPKYIPVTGCTVTIKDDKGNIFITIDQQDGNYECMIPGSALKVGTSFKVEILTPGGVNIESDFDQIFDCPEVDTVYYLLEDQATRDPAVFIHGIRFYVDLNAGNSGSHFFRWEPVETYEYHMTWPIEWYYDGVVHHVTPPDYSRFVCWKTSLVKNIYTLSTENLTENKYRLFPLHYVDNYSTSRLVYGYSLLLRQYALSGAAYDYWDKMRTNINVEGGLYEKQPLAIKGNLHNITNPDQEVLGFFGAAAMKSKRIFVSNVPDLPIIFDPDCSPGEPMRGGFKEVRPEEYPFYLYGNATGYQMRQIQAFCVDCLTLGGKNVKPDFWPN